MRVKSVLRNPFWVLGLVVLWRVMLLVFTGQPIPANDAFYFDGAMGNWLRHGEYCNPSIALVFPISGQQVFCAYPPMYQVALLFWMQLFGASVVSAMALHVAMFAVAGWLTVLVVKKYFPAATNYALVPLLFFAFTFDDRPEGLAHVFGMLSLWLVAKSISQGASWATLVGITLALLATLFTSCIPGALYFGAGFLALALVWLKERKFSPFLPYLLATFLFAAIVFAIIKMEPLWWAGFQAAAQQLPLASRGFHAPTTLDVVKLVRTVPVFFLGACLLPWLCARRREIFLTTEPWLALVGGIFLMGWIILLAFVTLLSADYVGQVLFLQVLLAAGLLALAGKFFPAREHFLRVVLLGCALLISIRAIGMTTWGVACAWKNSRQSAEAVLRGEFAPLVPTNGPVFVSSAFLYTAAELNVKNVVSADWYFDHAHWTNNADVIGLIRARPQKLVLTQFDYYRGFVTPLEKLRQQPGLVEIRRRDFAVVRTPDLIPSLQRVVQHISWAPVILDLEWKTPPPLELIR